MSNRYRTNTEQEGTKRRMSAWRIRQRDLGRKPHELWLTDDEYLKVKGFLEAVRQADAVVPPAATDGTT